MSPNVRYASCGLPQHTTYPSSEGVLNLNIFGAATLMISGAGSGLPAPRTVEEQGKLETHTPHLDALIQDGVLLERQGDQNWGYVGSPLQ